MHAGSCRCRSLLEAKCVPVTSVSFPTSLAISGLQLRCQAWLWQPDREGIVTCAGGTGLAVWPVVKTLWWRVYRVLTSCHVQLPQLWPVLISCCLHWINKGDMTQTNISFVWLRFLVLEKQNIPRGFFVFFIKVFLLAVLQRNTFSRIPNFAVWNIFFWMCVGGKKKESAEQPLISCFLTHNTQPVHFSLHESFQAYCYKLKFTNLRKCIHM